MAVIHCCGAKRKCRTFVLFPHEEFLEAKLFYLESCPVCGNTTAVLKRIDHEYSESAFRKSNFKAKSLFERLKLSIMFEEKIRAPLRLPASKHYLNYNHLGTIRRCYSNLRTLKLGLFDPDRGLDFYKRGKF